MERSIGLVLFIINICACLPEGHPPTEASGDAVVEVQESNDESIDSTDIQQVDSVNTDVSVDAIDQNEVAKSDDGKFDVGAEDDVITQEVEINKDTTPVDYFETHIKETTPSDDTFIDTETFTGVDTSVDVDSPVGVDTTPGVDTVDCPPGYKYDPVEGCVSFCNADKYFETNLGKCVYYPCCDLAGTWEVSVLDPDTMDFTVYSIFINQAVSYLSGDLILYSPLETSECYGTLEKKSFSLNCSNAKYKLIFTSGTAADTEISGFYSLDSKELGVKNGAFNMTNTM